MSAVTLVMVVFAGVVGPQSGRADHQLAALLRHDAKVEPVDLSPADMKALGTHSARAEKVVKHLHTDGVIAGEVIEGKHGRRLRVLVYDGDGNVVSQVEVPLDGESVSKSGMSMLREAIVADAVGLAGGSDAKKPAPASHDDGEDEAPVEKRPAKKVAKRAAKAEPPPREAEPSVDADGQAHDDDDTPAALASKSSDGDTSGTDASVSGAVEKSSMHMGVSVGVGVMSRNFDPTEAIKPYTASAAGALLLRADLEATRHLRFDALGERSLGLITAVDGMNAATAVSRWEAEASWSLGSGRFSFAPAVGFGQRTFTIDTKTTDRSPDSDYLYVVAGARIGLWLGKSVQLTAVANVEPVIAGDQPNTEANGEATRLGYDFGLSLDVPLTGWLVARLEGGYQAFNWSFYDGGGAVDAYAGASFSLGARY
jgi:hypothetical protein